MKNKLGWIGALATSIYLATLSITVILRFEEFKSLELNALGDFLAGGFGPIAFFWLVLGFFLQSQSLILSSKTLEIQTAELRQSTEALHLQAEELKRSVEQQTIMAAAAMSQVETQKNVLKMQREEAEHKMSAHFEVRNTLMMSGGTPHSKQLSIEIKNFGGDANEVATVFSPNLALDNEKAAGLIRGNATALLQFHVSNVELPYRGLFNIKYIGVDRVERSAVFKAFWKDVNGFMTFDKQDSQLTKAR